MDRLNNRRVHASLLKTLPSAAFVAASVAFGLAVCAWPVASHAEDSLPALLNVSPTSVQSDSIPLIRRIELQGAAQAVGAQAGLADRSKEILADLKYREHDLDQKWRFTDLLFANGVLPPVITTIRDSADVAARVMTVQGVQYRIEEPARFVSVPPTWRDWLFTGLTGGAPEVSQYEGSLPRDEKERVYWKEQLSTAYSAGRAQADAIFQANLARLARAYEGMRRFYQLHAQGMVSLPEIASATDSVVEDPNSVVIGQTVFRITADSKFTGASSWKPLAQ
ncbi:MULTISPECIES: type IV secretory system conjugative DNA transfer family protein [unclassified Burkholderia]|uniref:type IV secretory system conjugative DNA transfer family protein n=1 Tax=unclassified Burkholderia TaxID=2613784 RepID=UPI002AB2897C|nr:MULTISPECIES: type IV secretory system conjugative DNA transfer family protein [unclassified Burkholderia]